MARILARVKDALLNKLLEILIKGVVFLFLIIAPPGILYRLHAKLDTVFSGTEKLLLIALGIALLGIGALVYSFFNSFYQKRKANKQRPTHQFREEVLGIMWKGYFRDEIVDRQSLQALCPKRGCLRKLKRIPSKNFRGRSNEILMYCQRCDFRKRLEFSSYDELLDWVITELEGRIRTGQIKRP